MRKRFDPGRRVAGPAAYGRYGVSTVPVPIPVLAAKETHVVAPFLNTFTPGPSDAR